MFGQQTNNIAIICLTLFYIIACVATKSSLSLAVGYRKQWVSLEGAPENYYLTAHMPLAFINSGLGFQLEHDNIGFYQRSNIKVAYNYIKQFSRVKPFYWLNMAMLNARLDGSLQELHQVIIKIVLIIRMNIFRIL